MRAEHAETFAMLVAALDGDDRATLARARVVALREYVRSLTDWRPIAEAPRDGTMLLLAARPADYPLIDNEEWYQFTGSYCRGGWFCAEYDAFEKFPLYFKPLGPDPET